MFLLNLFEWLFDLEYNASLSFFQADVCHAYQILRKGGLKDENIIVFMYDDIAFNEHNPRPGIIINRPQGEDVYEGVPKVVFFIDLKSPLSEYGHDRFFFFMFLMYESLFP